MKNADPLKLARLFRRYCICGRRVRNNDSVCPNIIVMARKVNMTRPCLNRTRGTDAAVVGL